MNNKKQKAGKIDLIQGESPILIIAPHGFNGDTARKLKADDKDTGKLARRIAKEFGFFAVINEKYKRADQLGDADKNRGLVDCGRIDQVRKFLKAEFLDPILEYKEEIAAKYGHPLVFFVHGIDDSKMEEYISDYKADINLNRGRSRIKVHRKSHRRSIHH
jgi:hypothetical protein